jgi:hypothetical protein
LLLTARRGVRTRGRCSRNRSCSCSCRHGHRQRAAVSFDAVTAVRTTELISGGKARPAPRCGGDMRPGAIVRPVGRGKTAQRVSQQQEGAGIAQQLGWTSTGKRRRAPFPQSKPQSSAHKGTLCTLQFTRFLYAVLLGEVDRGSSHACIVHLEHERPRLSFVTLNHRLA